MPAVRCGSGHPLANPASTSARSAHERPLIIAIDGVAPGIGKSTLAAAVAAQLVLRGQAVDCFREEDILTHQAYGAVAEQFRRTDRVQPSVLLAATAEYVAGLRRNGVQVAVVDSLLPFIPSLLAWGHGPAAVSAFVHDLTTVLSGTALVVVYLDGAIEQALDRAVRREGEPWLGWLIGRLAGAAEPVSDLASLSAHLHRRRQITLSLLTEHGWNVVLVEDAQRRRTQEIVTLVLDALRDPWPAPAGKCRCR